MRQDLEQCLQVGQTGDGFHNAHNIDTIQCWPAADSGMCLRQALEAEEADFEDAKMIVVSRARLEQWVDEPFFERTMAGLLARVSLPVSKDKKKYLLLRIIGVVDRPEGIYKYSPSGPKLNGIAWAVSAVHLLDQSHPPG